jgi:hypothetical protein
MCLVAAAFPHLYLNDHDSTAASLMLPPRKLSCDLRGKACAHDFLSVGAFGTREEIGRAVEKMGLCLGTLHWFVRACLPPETEHRDYWLDADYFVMGSGGFDFTYAPLLQIEYRQEAEERWGIHLRVVDLTDPIYNLI